MRRTKATILKPPARKVSVPTAVTRFLTTNMKGGPRSNSGRKPGFWENIAGQRFGRLVALRRVGANAQRMTQWECLCDCGRTTVTLKVQLKNAHTQSCGCLHQEVITKHGAYQTSEYRAYVRAKQRCNPQSNNPKYRKHWSGRGIQFRFPTFECFLAEIGPRPGPGYSLDRINNDGHYEPGNVRWATVLEQRHNRRPSCRIPNSIQLRLF